MGEQSQASIGQATMNADGSLELRLRMEGPGELIGDGHVVYAPDDPHYQEVRRHLEAAHGPLAPGDQVSVPPWPDQD
jgi:hypothetical protein